MGMDTTQDPDSQTARRGIHRAERVELEVVFAADLSKVGARADLGPAERDLDRVVVGRLEPELALGTLRAPLADPCVSRTQLRVSWNAQRRTFRVDADGSRRPVSFFDPRGNPCAEGSPGPRLVAVGDRALLLLSVRRAEAPSPSIILGASDAMRALRARVLDVARQAEVALVTGPTGSGKELIARELHAKSRRTGPFIAINAAALPPDLVESELFGHVRGAFSGAIAPKGGLFQAASGGTLFLDEMGELPLALQAKLLRAVELRRIRPVGGTAEVDVDVRIVVATNRDLAAEVAAGRFRADLYQRLLGLHVSAVPLVDHAEDIGRLFVTFLRRHTSPEAEMALFRPASNEPPPLPMSFFLALLRHDLPGHVRELDRIALDVATRGKEAAVANTLAPSPHHPTPVPRATEPPPPKQRARATREELFASLARNGHVQHRVAKELGVPYATLDRWMREAGLRRPRDLSAEEIRQSVEEAGGVDAAAKALGLSARGLRLRMAELGL